MNLNSFLAKSDGCNIIDHTNNVVNSVSEIISRYPNIEKDEKDILNKSAILHDIAKLTELNQKSLKGEKKLNFKFRHNIIGWYFIIHYVKDKNVAKIANLVLWHHANNDSCASLNTKLLDIRDEITKDDLEVMKSFCEYYNIPLNDEPIKNTTLENEFYRVDNLLRSILISGDVCASSKINVNTLFSKKTKNIVLSDKVISSERTKTQLSIVNSIPDKTTTLVKANAGFGKTVIGLLYSIKRERQTIWVCPTNTIAKAVYENIIRDSMMFNINIPVELYLTGKREKANNSLPEFSSDIIITNIDNFIKPSVSNSYGYRALMIYDCDVIFDEVHEYSDMSCALFNAFHNIMDKRHNLLGSSTILLTATPTPFTFLNKNGKTIKYLPNEDEHYPALHGKKSKYFFHDEIPYHLMTGEFVFFNKVVDDVQDEFIKYQGPKLISHGRYLDEDKEYHKNVVLDNFGKNGEKLEYGVFTNQILTTACDYSVKKMFIKCPTIGDCFQGGGRVNRDGLYEVGEMHIILEKSNKEKKSIGGNRENDLQRLFVNELRKSFEDKEITLDEAYVFYNKFFKDNYNSYVDVIGNNLEYSKDMLKFVFPKADKKKTDKKIANGNKLRKSLSVDEIFVLVKDSITNEEIIMPFSVQKHIGTSVLFDEDENTFKEQVKIIKNRKGYNKHKKITPETLFRDAVNYETPYPVLNYIYCKELGLIKIRNYENKNRICGNSIEIAN